MSDKPKAPALTPIQREMFAAMCGNSSENLALMSGFFRGTPVAYVCILLGAEGNAVQMRPVAILIDDPFIEKFDSDISGSYNDSLVNENPNTKSSN